MAVGRITIEDVAAAAGVSRQTVTRAMNGLPEISARTRDHVLRTATELGYRPSRFASNLAARRKARSVGLVLGSLRNPYYTELAAELLDVVTPRGWQVLMASHEQGDDVELVAALSGQADAIVGYFTGPEAALVAAAAAFRWCRSSGRPPYPACTRSSSTSRPPSRRCWTTCAAAARGGSA